MRSFFSSQGLLDKVSSTWNIPQEQIVIFSPVHPKYIGAHQQITDEEFATLVEKSGGQEGHAKLYILTLQHLKADDPIDPDMSNFEPLSTCWGCNVCGGCPRRDG